MIELGLECIKLNLCSRLVMYLGYPKCKPWDVWLTWIPKNNLMDPLYFKENLEWRDIRNACKEEGLEPMNTMPSCPHLY